MGSGVESVAGPSVTITGVSVAVAGVGEEDSPDSELSLDSSSSVSWRHRGERWEVSEHVMGCLQHPYLLIVDNSLLICRVLYCSLLMLYLIMVECCI